MSILFLFQETISKEHAMRFPLIGSAVLLSLFLLFKFLPKDLINRILAAYFFVLGIIALRYVVFHTMLTALRSLFYPTLSWISIFSVQQFYPGFRSWFLSSSVRRASWQWKSHMDRVCGLTCHTYILTCFVKFWHVIYFFLISLCVSQHLSWLYLSWWLGYLQVGFVYGISLKSIG